MNSLQEQGIIWEDNIKIDLKKLESRAGTGFCLGSWLAGWFVCLFVCWLVGWLIG